MIKRIIRSFSLFISTLILMLSTFGTPALANGQEAGFLSEQDQEILQQYHDGNTESGLERRREIIEQNGLEAYVDEDGFLTGRFYDTHDLFAITRSHLVLIDRTQKAEYRSRLDELLKSGTTYQSVRALSVAGLSEVTAIWGPGTISNGLWKLSNNQFAFCADGRLAPPNAGTATSDPFPVNNAALRKALYYGVHGPENIMEGQGYTNEQMIVATNDFVSMAHTGTSVGQLAANGWHWNTWIKNLYDQIQAKPDPKSKGYEAYMVNVSGSGINWAGTQTALQPLVFGMYAPKGQAQIRKVSADPAISADNPNYSLAGAQYGLYSDPQAGNQIGTFTIRSDLSSNIISDLDLQTYYVKEIKAPQGYALDQTVYPLQVNADALSVLTCSDVPQANPVTILVQKFDKDTREGLADAEFTVKYYASAQEAPQRTWVLKSDKEGNVLLDEAHKVSGDAFYKNRHGQAVIPIGTVTIQETKAPAGYYADPAVHTQTISAGTDQQEILSVYKSVSVPNTNISLSLKKMQRQTDIPISNVVFLHTSPSGAEKEVTTDENGMIRWTHLEKGIHTLKEQSAPSGYELLEEPIRFEAGDQGIRLLNSHPSIALKDHVMTVFNKEKPVKVRIVKKNEKGNVLRGAQFTVYADEQLEEAIETVETDEHGQAEFKALEPKKKYWIRETKAPAGYRLPKDETYVLYFESVPAQGALQASLNGKEDHEALRIEEADGEKTIVLDLINYTGVQLPRTGSAGALWFTGAGCLSALYALYKRKGK